MCVHMVWTHGKAGHEHYVFSLVRRLASKLQGSPYLYLLACQQCSQLLCRCYRQETSPSAHATSALVAKPHSHPHGEPFNACIHYDTSSFWHPSNLLACLPIVSEQSHPRQSLGAFWFLLPKTDLKIFPQVFFNWCRFFNLYHLWSNIKSHLRIASWTRRFISLPCLVPHQRQIFWHMFGTEQIFFHMGSCTYGFAIGKLPSVAQVVLYRMIFSVLI